MPKSNAREKRINPTIKGVFQQHLDFLRTDTGLEYTGVIRLAVADLAKRRGFVAPTEPPPSTKPTKPTRK